MRALALLLAPLLVLACDQHPTAPTAVTLSLQQQSPEYGPMAGTCPAADIVVSGWEDPDPTVPTLRTVLQDTEGSAGKVIALAGVITVPDQGGTWTFDIDGITLTCAGAPAAADTLRLEAMAWLRPVTGAPIVVQGLIIAGYTGYNHSLYLDGSAANPRPVVQIAYNEILGPWSLSPLSVVNVGAGSEVHHNYFATESYGANVLLMHVPGVQFHHNFLLRYGGTTPYGAIQVQGDRSGMSIADNVLETLSYPGYDGTAVALRGLSGAPPDALASVARNVVLGPWHWGLQNSASCNVDWPGNHLDGDDAGADVYLGAMSCRNRVTVLLQRPDRRPAPYGPRFTVVDLGTDNRILGVANAKRGTSTAPPFADLPIFCPPGNWDEASQTCGTGSDVWNDGIHERSCDGWDGIEQCWDYVYKVNNVLMPNGSWKYTYRARGASTITWGTGESETSDWSTQETWVAKPSQDQVHRWVERSTWSGAWGTCSYEYVYHFANGQVTRALWQYQCE